MSNVVKLKLPTRPFSLDDVRLDVARLPTRPGTRTPRKLRPRVSEPFVLVPVHQLRRGIEVCSGQQILVWLYILHRAKLEGRDTVSVATSTLSAWGVDRFTKARALQALEAAGLITVERRRNRNPLATVTPMG